MFKSILYFLLILISSKSYGAADTIKIYFDIGIAQLDAKAMHTIDSAAYYDVLARGKKIGIIGYADYLGSDESNITLSENRAQNVRAYCEEMGVKPEDIELVMGKGEVRRNTENGNKGYREDRRVDIVPGGFKKKEVPVSKPLPVKNTKPLIDLSTVKENETIRLDKLFFLPGRHYLREESMIELLKLHKVMADNPNLKISIEGHICCLLDNTTDGYDYDTEEFSLSVNRARHIYEYLLHKGIAKERMQYKGFGKTRPLVAEERTPEDENMNRRVEVRVLSK